MILNFEYNFEQTKMATVLQTWHRTHTYNLICNKQTDMNFDGSL